MAKFYFCIKFKWSDGTPCSSIIYNDSILYRSKFIDYLKFQGCTDISWSVIHRKENEDGKSKENV